MANETLDKMWKMLKENEFQIDVAVNSEIHCASCKHVLIKPRTVPCGCRYCYDCLISYLNGEEKFCLGELDYCKSELINIDTNVFIDQPANIKISRIVVKCPLESCEFYAELGKMADHMRTCNRQPVTCPYSGIGCEENKLGVHKMKMHLKQENYDHAILLMEFLDNWKNEVKLLKREILELHEENNWIKEQMESKQETISALEENVKNLLQENRSLKELETEKIHENTRIKDMISEIKIKSKEQKEDIIKNKGNLEEMEISQEQMKTRIEGIGHENRSLRGLLEIIKNDNKSKEKIICAIQKKSSEEEEEKGKDKKNLELLEKNCERLKTRMDKMCEENAVMISNDEERENEIKILETKLTQVQLNQNFEFVWCIENWDNKKDRARSGIETTICSKPFYSHRNGYKMCLELNPDGGCSGEGTHLFLGICIMRGPFDNILSWPFQDEIKLELINQVTGLAHVSKILDCEDSLNRIQDCLEKPKQKKNPGFGLTEFIELSELSSNVALCRDNQILIKATPQMNL